MTKYTEQQIGQALKRCREQFLGKPDNYAAVLINVSQATQYRRERGERMIKISDFLSYADSWDVDPVELWIEFLSYCTQCQWRPIAEKLGCTVPMAKRRFKSGQERYGIGFGEMWQLVKNEQVEI